MRRPPLCTAGRAHPATLCRNPFRPRRVLHAADSDTRGYRQRWQQGLIATRCSIVFAAVRFGFDEYKVSGGGRQGLRAAGQGIGRKVADRIRGVTGFSVSPTQALIAVALLCFLAIRMTSTIGGGLSAARSPPSAPPLQSLASASQLLAPCHRLLALGSR